ncbi:putative ribonuclease H-like domain-containing protein [Tanacetum coccineum]
MYKEEEQVFLDELEKLKRQEKEANEEAKALRKEYAQETENLVIQAEAAKASSTNLRGKKREAMRKLKLSRRSIYKKLRTYPHEGLSLSDPTNPEQDDIEIPSLEDIYKNSIDGIFTNSSYDDEGIVADFTNLETVVNVSPIPTSRIISSHPSALILGDLTLAVQTRSKVNKSSGAHAFVSYKILEALEDESWVDAMQEELLQFKIQKFWILVDLPSRKKAIGTKWVFQKYEGYEEGVVVRIKQDYAFLYGKIDEEVYVSQPPGFLDPKYPQKVYKVVKALYGLHQAPRAWYATLSTFLLKNGYRRGTIDKTLFIKKDKHDIILVQVYVDDIIFGSTKKSWCDEFEALMKSRFQMSSMGELTFFLGLQVKQKEDGIFISQDKYVAEILKKFDFANVKTASTPIETQKPLVKDEEASDVSVLVLDSDYARANLDRKSTTGGCQFLGRRLISWQCKKQTIVATSTTEAEYVAAASCCGQVLWIQNQMLDYGFNFMNTKIYIDNESTICIVKNPVYHSKTKHIAIRHHFIRDAYEKKLIQVLKIHTDDNVADLLTKAFDVSRHLDAKKKFFMYPRFISIFLDKQLANVPVPLYHFPVNALTSKVFSFMVKKGKHFSGKVTPLFASMLVQPTQDEGVPSERPSEAQPTPSLTHPSEVHVVPQTDSSPTHPSEVPIEPQTDPSPRPSPSTIIPDSIPETSGGNLGGHSSSDKSLSGNEGEMTLQSGRKFAKGEPSVHKDPLFDEIPEETLDNIETENAQDVGRTSDIVVKLRGTDRQIEGTDEQIEGTDEQRKDSDDHTEEGSATQTTQPPPTSTIFRDDETIAKVLLNILGQANASHQERRRKHVGNFKHSELKTKKFEEIQALYEKIKRSDVDFISLGNRCSQGKSFIQNTSEDDSEKENDELRLYLTIAPDEEKEVDYEILDRKYPIKEWKTECLRTKPQVDKAEHLEEINQNVWSLKRCTMAFGVGLDFVKKLLAELEPEDSNGDEGDL